LVLSLAAAALAVAGSGAWFAVGAPDASAATTFTAKVNLNARDAASLDANVVKVDMYLAGKPVNVTCQDRGGMAYGSTIWDKTTENVWVPDAYVKTGSDGWAPGVPRCSDLGQDGHDYKAKADLNGRAGAVTEATAVSTPSWCCPAGRDSSGPADARSGDHRTIW